MFYERENHAVQDSDPGDKSWKTVYYSVNRVKVEGSRGPGQAFRGSLKIAESILQELSASDIFRFASFLSWSPNLQMWLQLWDYCTQPLVLTILTTVSVGIFVIGFLLVPPLAVKLPADHFVRPEKSAARHTLRDWLWFVSRNLFALVLLAAGAAMIVLPGPGIITIIVAVALADFPGKRRLERAFIRSWIVRTALNAMRNKYGAPPMIIPEADGNFVTQNTDLSELSNQSPLKTKSPSETPQAPDR